MRRIRLLFTLIIAFLTLSSFAFGQEVKDILTINNAIPYFNVKALQAQTYTISCKTKNTKGKTKPKFYSNYLEVVDHKFFKLGYSEKHEQPAWVIHLLTKEMVLEHNAKRSNKFREDYKVSTKSSLPKDYRNSGYDKGHICPSADMSFSQEAQDLTFLMSNISPQLHSFNAGKWHELEKKVREWAVENDSIIVIAGALFDSIIQTIGKKNKVSVPYRFYKVIVDVSFPSYKAIGFIMENEKLKEELFYYSVSVSELERITGFNFFPDFDDNMFINNLENNCNIKNWEDKY